MGESLMQMFHGASSAQAVEDEMFDSDSLSSDSENSIFSSSSSDLAEDASSSSPDGPLYDLSSIMEDLPIKRGLSKYYQGKSQSFACLSDVSCLEDLAKKGSPLRRKLKSSKSYGRLDASQKRSYAPGPHSKAISKRVSRNTVVSSVVRRSSDSFLCSSKPPTIPHNRNIGEGIIGMLMDTFEDLTTMVLVGILVHKMDDYHCSYILPDDGKDVCWWSRWLQLTSLLWWNGVNLLVLPENNLSSPPMALWEK